MKASKERTHEATRKLRSSFISTASVVGLSCFCLGSLAQAENSTFRDIGIIPGMESAPGVTDTKVILGGDVSTDLPPPPPTNGNCYIKKIQPRAFEPDAHPIAEVVSPLAQTSTLTTEAGSFEFYVDMPVTETARPYRLAPNGDFDGTARICPRRDYSTGRMYDEVTFTLQWNPESGGVYTISYAYSPFVASRIPSSQRIETKAMIVVDGGIKTDEKLAGKCLGGSSLETLSPPGDLVLTPRQYANDSTIAKSRGFFAPKWKYVSDLKDTKTEIDAAFKNNGNKPVDLILDSHGNIDLWVGMEGEMAPNLRGNSATVQSFAEIAGGKVKQIYFTSCCTGKGKAQEKNPNVLDSITLKIKSSSATSVPTCGTSHMQYAWVRDGKFHIGITKGDTFICSKAG